MSSIRDSARIVEKNDNIYAKLKISDRQTYIDKYREAVSNIYYRLSYKKSKILIY